MGPTLVSYHCWCPLKERKREGGEEGRGREGGGGKGERGAEEELKEWRIAWLPAGIYMDIEPDGDAV